MGQWIFSPILQYALFVAGIALCLNLFCSVKVELRALEKRAQEKHLLLQGAIRQLDLKAELPAAPAAVYLPRTSGIELTTRAQALRMDRRGESPATIAAALSVPRNEIDLMLKVHRLMTEEHEKPFPMESVEAGR